MVMGARRKVVSKGAGRGRNFEVCCRPPGGVAEKLSAGGRGGDYFLEAIVTPGGGSENSCQRGKRTPHAYYGKFVLEDM